MEKNSLLDTSNKPGSGPVFGVVIIIIVLLVGAVVVFSEQYKESKELQELYKIETETSDQNPNLDLPTQTTYSTSTNIEDIEKDLEDSNLDNLEDSIDAIDTDIK